MYIKVKAYPESKVEKVEKVKDDSFKIWIKEPAERNLANNRIVEVIRNHFPKAKDVRIINGHSSPSKMLSLDFGE